MNRRGQRGGVGGCAVGLLLCVAVLPVLWISMWKPRHFDPVTWSRTDGADRTKMARDFVARGLWRDASRSELVAVFGEPVEAVTHASWPLPDALVGMAHGVSRRPGAGSAADRPRLLMETSERGFRLMLDSGIRDSGRILLARYEDPNEFTWAENLQPMPGALTGSLVAATLQGAADDLAELCWRTGSIGFTEERTAWLTIRLLNDRAIDAWVSH